MPRSGQRVGRIVPSRFRPAWWLPGAHLQTLWPSLVRPQARSRPPVQQRRIELADGDFIELSSGPRRGPRVLIIHGLEGDLRSHYAGSLFARLAVAGFTPVFMHLRGTGSEPNRLDRSYHSGATEDLMAVLTALAADAEGLPAAAVGFSLGGNLLLKYLGERVDPQIPQAIAISVPFVLRDAMLRLNLGLSRIYRRHLLGRLKAGYRRKFHTRAAPLAVDLDAIGDFNDFDDRITAPLHGFAGAYDYYRRCACRQFLPTIHTPTLIIQARDDPFLFPQSLPCAHELGPGITLELATHGGHVGFIAGHRPWRPLYWLEERVLAHLQAVIPGN
ncbi:MAG: hydrolase [Chromatiaceae bacterium]|nr:MAG: hydrolase [Chromatiaceae bacterium]